MTIPVRDEVLLERMKFAAQAILPGEMVADFKFHENFFADQLALQLKTEVLGKRHTQGMETVRFHVPRTWFDAWLQQTWLGRKVARWRKPRLRSRDITVHWERMLTLPHWAADLPPYAGRVVVYEPRRVDFKEVEPDGTD